MNRAKFVRFEQWRHFSSLTRPVSDVRAAFYFRARPTDSCRLPGIIDLTTRNDHTVSPDEVHELKRRRSRSIQFRWPRHRIVCGNKYNTRVFFVTRYTRTVRATPNKIYSAETRAVPNKGPRTILRVNWFSGIGAHRYKRSFLLCIYIYTYIEDLWSLGN